MTGGPGPGRPRQARHDAIVIGGGLLGLAAAWSLTRGGADVVLLERADSIGHAAGGSKGSCRVFRLGHEDVRYVSLAVRARELWAELEEECGERLLTPTPQVTFGDKAAAIAAALREAGRPGEELSAAEAMTAFPMLAVDGPALLERSSCVISADRALAALAAGVPDIRLGVSVAGIADDGRGVTVRHAAGSLAARAAVVCAGPWTGRILARSGLTLPGRASLEQVGYARPPSRGLGGPPIFIRWGEQAFYGLPVPGSALCKIGLHECGPPVDPDRQGDGGDPALSDALRRMTGRYLPGYAEQTALAERCAYDNSPDRDFIVHRDGNIVIGCGTSGHGFKFGPLFGAWLAALAGAGGPAPPAMFALDRFTAGPT